MGVLEVWRCTTERSRIEKHAPILTIKMLRDRGGVLYNGSGSFSTGTFFFSDLSGGGRACTMPVVNMTFV